MDFWVLLPPLAVYLATMSSGVTAEDCGEIAAALHGLAIVHPTGYPLYTMLGWIFAHLPTGARVIWNLNFFGATCTAVAAVLFYRLFAYILSPRVAKALWRPAGSVSLTGEPSRNESLRFAAAAAALVFAFTRVFWTEALSLEVYALHLVFLAGVSLAFLRALEAISVGAACADRRWILFAYVLGLSFAHHMMTVLLAPAFLYLFFTVCGWGRVAWKRIGAAVIPFLLGLTPYLYLPLRSAQNPVMNWGEPKTLSALWYHVAAKQYRGQMFSSFDIAFRKTLQFFADLPRDFGYAPLLLAALGAWLAFRGARRLFVFTILLFVGCLFYAVNYAFDDPNFYLNAHLAVAIVVAVALHEILSRLALSRVLAVALCLAVIAFPLATNFSALDKRHDRAVEEYALNVLNSMDSGAVYFTNEYQRMAAPAFYLQQVEHVRPDVAVIDIVLLANPWYFPHLAALHPWLIEGSRKEFEAYLPELHRFIAGHADSLAYNARVRDLFLAILKASDRRHPVFASANINLTLAPGYKAVPAGMGFRLVRETDSVAFVPRDPVFHAMPPPEYNPEAELIRNEYAESYANQGAYLLETGDTATGVRMLRQALVLVPAIPEVIQLLNAANRR